MAWAIEKEYVDLAEMKHRTVYIERSVKTASGEPVRHVDDILLGAHGPSTARGFNSGGLSLGADGKLTAQDGTEVDPKARQRQVLVALDAMHAAGKAYARKHRKRVGAPAKR